MFTLIVGYVVGRKRLWRQLAIGTGAGTGTLLLWYSVAMIVFSNPKDTNADNAAGAGIVILAIPSLLVVASLLYLGAALGRISSRTPHTQAER
jgi:hypothetical protein